MSGFDLITAVKPTKRFILNLQAELQKKLKQKVTLNLKTEPGILGGAVITYQGYYFDMSLKRKLEEYFEKNKKAVLKELE